MDNNDQAKTQSPADAGSTGKIIIKSLALADGDFSALWPLCALAIIALAVSLAASPVTINSQLAITGSQLPPARITINPNTADWPELMLLPGIGQVKARDICNYRERQRLLQPREQIFTCCEDLENVYGIGPATAGGLSGWVSFAPEQH